MKVKKIMMPTIIESGFQDRQTDREIYEYEKITNCISYQFIPTKVSRSRLAW